MTSKVVACSNSSRLLSVSFPVYKRCHLHEKEFIWHRKKKKHSDDRSKLCRHNSFWTFVKRFTAMQWYRMPCKISSDVVYLSCMDTRSFFLLSSTSAEVSIVLFLMYTFKMVKYSFWFVFVVIFIHFLHFFFNTKKKVKSTKERRKNAQLSDDYEISSQTRHRLHFFSLITFAYKHHQQSQRSDQ